MTGWRSKHRWNSCCITRRSVRNRCPSAPPWRNPGRRRGVWPQGSCYGRGHRESSRGHRGHRVEHAAAERGQRTPPPGGADRAKHPLTSLFSAGSSCGVVAAPPDSDAAICAGPPPRMSRTRDTVALSLLLRLPDRMRAAQSKFGDNRRRTCLRAVRFLRDLVELGRGCGGVHKRFSTSSSE